MKEGKREFGKTLPKVVLPEDLHRKLKLRAVREGQPLHRIVGEMLRAQLKVER